MSAVSLPLWVVIAQWTALFGLVLLVVMMYRQLGYFLYASQSRSENAGIGEGEPAPVFQYSTDGETPSDVMLVQFKGRWTLLVFVDPLCSGCERALHALDKVREEGVLPRGVETVVATSAPPMRRGENPAFAGRSDLVTVDLDAVGRLYHVNRLPFTFLIDPAGMVRAKGSPEAPAALRSMLAAVDRRTIPLRPVRA